LETVASNIFKKVKFNVLSNCFLSLKKLLRGGHFASDDLLNLAVNLGIISEDSTKFYQKITTGKGSRSHFDPEHKDFKKRKQFLETTSKN
jgi:hypothetical protein